MRSAQLALVAALLTGASAGATTLDFEGIAPSGGYTSYEDGGFSHKGFNFSLSKDHVIEKGFTASGLLKGNKSSWLMHKEEEPLTLDAAGAEFSLQRLDFKNWADSKVILVTVTGQLAAGGELRKIIEGTASFATTSFRDWTGLTSVSFTGTRRSAYDNIVVNDVGSINVPVPATLPLITGALGTLWLARRRKQS